MTRSVQAGSTASLTREGGAGNDGLCRSSVDELLLARSHRDALVAAAVAVVDAADHDPDVASCDDAGCGLAGDDAVASSVCATSHRLAALPDAPAAIAGVTLAVAVAGFHAALEGAADAIRSCRQTAHTGEGCWFSHAPGVDGCGEILRLLHRCG